MEATIAQRLIELGLPGIMLLVLGWACLNLYRRLEKLHDTRAEELRSLHVKTREIVERNTASLEQHAEVVSKLTETVKQQFARKGGGAGSSGGE